MIGDHAASRWRKASHSNSQGACVQVGQAARGITVRDTTDLDGPALPVTPAAWRAFTGATRAGRAVSATLATVTDDNRAATRPCLRPPGGPPPGYPC